MTRHRGEFVQVSSGYQLPGADAARQIISKSMDRLREEVVAQAIEERDQMLADARQILQEAQEEADRLLTQGLEEKLDGVLEEGRQHGYQVGYADGLAQIQQETLTLLEGANQIVDKACFAEQRMLHQFKTTAATLVTKICERIIGHHVWENPESLINMIEQAIESLALTTQVRLAVSHDLLEHIKQAVQNPNADAALKERFTRLVWVADKQLDRTQVFLQSREGQYDLSPDMQIATLVKAVQPLIATPVASSALKDDAAALLE